MILAWIFVGLFIALAIARIEQSNKLFWILFTSFMVGIAGSSVYNKCRESKCETSSSNHCLTLLTCDTMSHTDSVTIDESMCMSAPALTAAGNGKLEFNDEVVALSKCCVETRTEPPRTLKLKKVCWNILTHPEREILS